MWNTLVEWLGSSTFMPHGHCYMWEPGLLWLQVISNGLIGLSYIAIAGFLAVLVRRIQDIPFRGVYYAFSLFILSCGITHFFDVWVIWQPVYWADGAMRAVTATASVATALLLPPLIPEAVAVARGARSAEAKGIRLEEAIEDLESMYEQTKELEEAKTAFFANVSHELRTPLTLILGRARNLVEDDMLSQTQRRALDVIIQNGRLLQKHVDDLLEIASMEAGQLEPSRTDFDLSALVRRSCSGFDALADDYGITYAVEAPDSLPVRADADQLESLLVNLLGNAFKFTPDGGRIRCALSAEPPRHAEVRPMAVLQVEDSGPGVPADARDTIFERFVQLDTGASRRFGGTGLGLVVARNVAEMHGGTITVTDSPAGGALFEVRLPIGQRSDARTVTVRESGEAPDAPRTGDGQGAVGRQQVRRERRARGAATASGLARAPRLEASNAIPGEEKGDAEGGEEGRGAAEGRPAVLIVEDHVELNEYMGELVADFAETHSAFGGRGGLSLAAELEPDLIIVDLMMPQVSGKQVVERIRADDRLCDTAILVVTAKANDETRVHLLQMGADDFLQKPFLPAELRIRARNLLSVKRTRDLLVDELEDVQGDIEQLAAALARRSAELERTLESARVARQQAESASQLKSRFLGMVSHELRTPLAAFPLYIALVEAEHERLSDRQRVSLQRLSRAVDRMTTLIEGLLRRAAIERGRLEVQPEMVDLVELVDEMVAHMRPYAIQERLDLVLHSPRVGPPVRTDPRLVRLIVSNLVGNAIKFTDGGHVAVCLDIDGERVQIAVSDTGPGISLSEQLRIFDDFHKGEVSTEAQLPGAGLGLALVRDMVSVLGGEIAVESAPGEGSTFRVELPRELPTAGDHEQQASASSRTDN
jgi:signal transduction histidine kinase